MTLTNGPTPEPSRRSRRVQRIHRRKLSRLLRRLETRHTVTFTLTIQAPRVAFGRTLAVTVTLLLTAALLVPWVVGIYTLLRSVTSH